MLQNAYLVAKIGADTAEDEQDFAEILPKTGNYPARSRSASSGSPSTARSGPSPSAAAADFKRLPPELGAFPIFSRQIDEHNDKNSWLWIKTCPVEFGFALKFELKKDRRGEETLPHIRFGTDVEKMFTIPLFQVGSSVEAENKN